MSPPPISPSPPLASLPSPPTLQSGPAEITTRWTMRMFFRLLPWVPEVVFTGLSIYGVDLPQRKFVSHKAGGGHECKWKLGQRVAAETS